MSMSSTRCDHDDCMICLCPLLAHDNDNEADSLRCDDVKKEECGVKEGTPAVEQEIGAVFPCGHCFHVS